MKRSEGQEGEAVMVRGGGDEMTKKNKGKRTGQEREYCLGRRNKAASECRTLQKKKREREREEGREGG